MYLCPVCNEQSTDSEFCSECGAPMGGPVAIAAIAAPVVAAPAVEIHCPDCNELKTGDFCAECGYNFLTGVSGAKDEEVVVEAAPVVQVVTIVTPNIIPVAAVPANAIPVSLVVQTDCTLNPDKDAIPFEESDRFFPIDLAETLIGGRKNDAKKIYPDVIINDGGISTRHLKLIYNASGALELLDLNSSNGTIVNGVEVQAGVPVALNIGDEILIGAWTRIKVASR